MRSPKHIILLLVAGLLCVSTIHAQNKTQLQNKKKKKQKNQEASVKQIEKLNTSIETRVELVNNYAEEVNMIAQEINLNEKQVSSLESQLKALKQSYSKMVYQSWKTRNSMSTWMFIFSAKNFNQAIRRYRYYKQINQLRIVQSNSIKKNKNESGNKIGSMKVSREEKETVLH